MNRTAVLGEMYEPEDALTAGFLDRVVPQDMIDQTLADTVAALRTIHKPSHATAKRRLRRPTAEAMRAAIEQELTMSAYEASKQARSAVVLPGAGN